MSVNPKVIETPMVAAVAKNGIEVKYKARVTVRANIERLVGGAGEETIIARVGEGIVTTVGSGNAQRRFGKSRQDLPNRSRQGFGYRQAFEILSIDIADVDVGRNIGAELQTDQAEADKRIAQAKAEERRAMAVASEQEMMADVRKCAPRLWKTKPSAFAMAEAFRKGNLGVMDYYNIKNILRYQNARRHCRCQQKGRLMLYGYDPSCH